MFVFWYCHKRGKQVRLDREIEEGKANEEQSKEQFDGSDFDATDSDGGDNGDDDIAEQIATAVKEDRDDDDAAALKRKEDALNKPEPSRVPAPDAEKGEKGASLEAEKGVGV